jgi:hypothetical protein
MKTGSDKTSSEKTPQVHSRFPYGLNEPSLPNDMSIQVSVAIDTESLAIQIWAETGWRSGILYFDVSMNWDWARHLQLIPSRLSPSNLVPDTITP